MPRSASPGRSLLLLVSLLLSLAPVVTSGQPAPNPCPDGEVFVSGQDRCVPEAEAPPVGGNTTGQPPAGGPDSPDVSQGVVADLTFLHYACDAGFDPRAGTGDRNVSCTGAGKPAFTYTIAINGHVIASTPVLTGDGTRGRLDLDSTSDRPIPAGDMVISVAPLEGWTSAWVVCEIDNPLEGSRVVEPAIVDNAVTVALAADEIAVCDWFNVATTGEGAGNPGVPPVVDEETGPGADITIAAFTCPAGTTVASDLAAACTEPASGLEFSLLTATATLAVQASSATGDIFFADVAPGSYGIAVALPSGYGEPVVLCQHARAAGAPEEGARDIVFGNQFRFTIAGNGEFLECAWFNLPALGADDGPNIFIEAHQCAPASGITSSMTVFDALALCPSVYTGLEFSVLNVDQLIATARTNTDPLSAGQVFFTRLPEPASGAYAVVANAAAGERTLAVFCDQDFGDGTFQIVPVRVSGHRLDQELGMAAGDTLRCSWFIEASTGANPPAEEGEAGEAAEAPVAVTPGITVLARLCPPEIVAQRVVLADVCTLAGTGIAYDVTVEGAPAGTVTTDANGALTVPTGTGAGAYVINNQPTPGISEPEVSCVITHADGSVEGAGGFVPAGSPGQEIAFDGSSEVVCTFYFLGEPTGEGGAGAAPALARSPDEAALPGVDGAEDVVASEAPALTLRFLVCPAGADPAADPEELAQACPVETVERSFILSLDGVATGQAVTGSGTWTPADLTVQIDLGFGPESRVHCRSSWIEGAEQVPATSSLEGVSLTVTLSHPQTAVSCDWFMFPE